MVIHHVRVGFLQLNVFIQGVVDRAEGDVLLGELSLVLGDDLEGAQDTG